MTKRIRWASFLVLVLLLAFLPAQAFAAKQVVIGINQEPDNLNPAITTMVHASYVLTPMFRGLVKYGPDLQYQPDLALRLPTVQNGDVSADGKTVTWRLKRGQRWSDGREITSADVRYTILLLAPDPKKPGFSRSGQKITPGSTVGVDKIDTVTARNKTTVVIKFKETYAPYLTLLGPGIRGVMPAHVYSRFTNLDTSGLNTKPTVSSGPYKFERWVSGQNISLVINSRFTGSPKPAIDRITFKIIPSTQSLIASIKANQVDMAFDLKEQNIPTLASTRGWRMHSKAGLLFEHLDFCFQRSLFRDKRVRQAIEAAINKQQLVRSLLRGLSDAAASEHPPGSLFADPALKVSTYNPAAARSLLAAAGWKDSDGDGFRDKNFGGKNVKLTFRVSTTAGNKLREQTETLLAAWLKAVGIDLKIQNFSPDVLFAGYAEGGVLTRCKYDMALFAWGYDSPDTDTSSIYHSRYIPPKGQNALYFKNNQLNANLDAAVSTLNLAKRAQNYRAASRVIRAEVPTILLYWRSNVSMVKLDISGFVPHKLSGQETSNVAAWRR